MWLLKLHPWLTPLAAVMLAAMLAEALVLSRQRPQAYCWRGALASVATGLGKRVVDATLGSAVSAAMLALAWQHRISTISLTSLAQWATLWVLHELAYYGFHRASHRVRWLWASHAVHHSPEQLTLATSLRLGWTGQLTGNAVFFVPLVGLGFAPQAVALVMAVNLAWQFWLHNTWMPRLGPLEWVLNTPAHHRIHHASNPAYLDCNYGGMLIVFDRLFGTFRAERADTPPRYGLVTPLHSFNPLRIALHEWLNLARDLRTAPHLRARLTLLIGPPRTPSPSPTSSPTQQPS